VLNALLYHLPLFAFVAGHLAVSSFMGGLTLATLLMALLASTVLPLTALALISSRLLKPCCMLMALCSSIALYFVLTYHAVLDETMMGNVWNTNLSESLEFLHPTLFLYLLVLGVLPCLVLARVHIRQQSRLRLAVVALVSSSVVIAWGLAASSTWLWFDKNSKVIGGLAMPWSYLINMGRYELPTLMASDKQVPLPPATFASNTKTVVMLVIGEAARAANFQLYGYSRPTNPLLSKAGVVALRNARSCATYTTASLHPGARRSRIALLQTL
jgi:lipid A ethanolaminephosphotransferase